MKRYNVLVPIYTTTGETLKDGREIASVKWKKVGHADNMAEALKIVKAPVLEENRG